ncbi:hypothetical protein E2C01_089327 [Portunus trituberculatus]|uniref:Uncharacterized protein n=1 Tax=Portunus trituberculatus TaxID=210409 RepID=A0A5B7J8I2_PORTR|nr:hypothetical protein [Portunus trituberculatus]
MIAGFGSYSPENNGAINVAPWRVAGAPPAAPTRLPLTHSQSPAITDWSKISLRGVGGSWAESQRGFGERGRGGRRGGRGIQVLLVLIAASLA